MLLNAMLSASTFFLILKKFITFLTKASIEQRSLTALTNVDNSAELKVINEFMDSLVSDSDGDNSDYTSINSGSITLKRKRRNGKNKLTLKKLCATRWSSRINYVRAVKNRYGDLLHVLNKLKEKRKR
ncbi:Hypothetical predicted protein [Paramuricea clavata]|uniref:Uncharacterized protein n=1 Tax=Paramuricea clavata TaxID=317549 RepID=A0A7D9LKG0_PARCT|nr:Hypothetical predicted protein [Paramuricea clavata]